MSVRDGLLAILLLGPAYGSQLHAELAARAPHRGPVNVGQIYSTLDRLAKQRLLVVDGTTDDGLPLHRLTPPGRAAAEAWLREPVLTELPEWTEMLDQIVIGSSISPAETMTTARRYRSWFTDDLAEARRALGDASGGIRLAMLAREARDVAALAWLGSATDALVDLPDVMPLATGRPRRGRRPKALTVGPPAA